MNYLSVCSGIEAATVAWHPLSWTPVAFSEIEAFPSAVLAHHYQNVPNWGDMTRFKEWPDAAVDVLVGGTPCQSFSVAGLRGGLADPRGNLALTYLAIAERYRPRWLVWENVPGVLSADKGRALGAFLGGLAELGYGFAWRMLDAQYAGLAQRRKRVFVVGHLGDWRRAAAVLFESASLRGDPAPSREAGKGTAPTISSRPTGGGGLGTDFDCDGGLVNALTERPDRGGGNSEGQRLIAATSSGRGYWNESDIGATVRSQESPNKADTLIAHALRAEGFDASEGGTGRGVPLVPDIVGCHANAGGQLAVAFDTTQITSKANYSQPKPGDPCHPLASGAHPPAVAFDARQSDVIQYGDKTGPLDTDGSSIGIGIGIGSAVRRLTPKECARLQGFPDTYLDITYRGKPAADGPKYKALGNSMAVPVMTWIGRRIAAAGG